MGKPVPDMDRIPANCLWCLARKKQTQTKCGLNGEKKGWKYGMKIDLRLILAS